MTDSFKFCPPGSSANHFQMVDWNVVGEEFGSLTPGQLSEGDWKVCRLGRESIKDFRYFENKVGFGCCSCQRLLKSISVSYYKTGSNKKHTL